MSERTRFPYEITEKPSGLFKLRFANLPSLKLFGRNHYVLRLEAAWALNAFISMRIQKELAIPRPGEGRNSIPLQEHTEFRLGLHWRLWDSGLTKSEFARELEVSEKMLSKILHGIGNEAFSPYIRAVASEDIGVAEDGASICEPTIGSKDDKAQLALLAV